MNIIFVSNSMAKAKTLSVLQVSMIALALVLIPTFITIMLILPQETALQKGVKSLIPPQLKFFNNQQKHLDVYAVQLGEMQARIMRLDAQSDRLSKLAGDKASVTADKAKVKKDSSPSNASKDGKGGPLVRNSPLSEADLQQYIADLMAKIDLETDQFSGIEAKLLQQSVLKDMLPNSSPVSVAFNSSSYGWRIDPFNGEKAFHEGLDFPAAVGTRINAAAGGIVSFAGPSADYGKLIRIDHGSGLETRYAHSSKLFVTVGQRVEKGQEIAEIGNTGRSTGPHLHYEIRFNGNALDPRRYLKASI
jgi:murein DD-endopeptidase MepM/ murein hydrolase activator NlpD